MLLGQYNFWNSTTNSIDTTAKEPHLAADTLPDDYTDVSSIGNWALYGPGIIGTTTGFRDWKCLQREIKTLAFAAVGNDFNKNWGLLNEAEQQIVCEYILSSVPPDKFALLYPDPDQRLQIAMNYDLNNRRARGNWQVGTGRMQVMLTYLFCKIGRTNTLEVLNDLIHDGLPERYESGIEGTVESGHEGINDFFLSRDGTSYATTGLTKRAYTIVDGSKITLTDVANALVAIASDGIY